MTTFDEGILTIYSVTNSAQPGDKPVYSLTQKAQYYYGYSALGITRYYTALEANQQIEDVVNVPEWVDVTTDDICQLENGVYYRIRLVQKELDKDNLKITKLSLERTGELYGLSSP